MSAVSATKAGPATKYFLDIAEIRDDVVVMKDGTMRAVLMVSSINFALKSEEEQAALIQAYMAFLNGLEAPLQIVIQSRKMNVDPYLNFLSAREKEISNELLKAQIADYRSFVKELVELGEIMEKRFYVTVPFNPASSKRKNFWTRFTEALSPVFSIKLKEQQFRERREELIKLVNIINSQLSSMGVNGVLLDTQSLIELCYSSYNPDLFGAEKMAEVSKIRLEE